MKKEDFQKLSKKERSQLPFKELPGAVKFWIIIIMTVTIVAALAISGCSTTSSESTEMTQQRFDQLPYKSKDSLLKAWNEQQYDNINREIYKMVSEYCAFPASANIISVFPIAVVDADSMLCRASGKVSETNPLGVTSVYRYEVTFLHTVDSLHWLEGKVYE